MGGILGSTYDPPPMISEADLAVMRPGAVIVDATCGYGPGYLPAAGPVQAPGDPPHQVAGVLHVKVDVFPALVPVTATTAYVANATPYLEPLARTPLLRIPDTANEAGRIPTARPAVRPGISPT